MAKRLRERGGEEDGGRGGGGGEGRGDNAHGITQGGPPITAKLEMFGFCFSPPKLEVFENCNDFDRNPRSSSLEWHCRCGVFRRGLNNLTSKHLARNQTRIII